jgi:hypothetical protein
MLVVGRQGAGIEVDAYQADLASGNVEIVPLQFAAANARAWACAACTASPPRA